MLLVPGHEKRKIDKAFSMKVDCLAFDLDSLVRNSDKVRTFSLCLNKT